MLLETGHVQAVKSRLDDLAVAGESVPHTQQLLTKTPLDYADGCTSHLCSRSDSSSYEHHRWSTTVLATAINLRVLPLSYRLSNPCDNLDLGHLHHVMLCERQLPGDGALHTAPVSRYFSRDSVVFLARCCVSIKSVPLPWELDQGVLPPALRHARVRMRMASPYQS